MNQVTIGSFLKTLRKEKNMTQEALAEKLGVSNRTISRWETGNNMPDISMLVEIAEFYDVSIPEIINGERKSEVMDKETKETAMKMADYSHNETKNVMQKVTGILLSVFGIFTIISAVIIVPAESSWGSIYSVIGSIILITGIYIVLVPLVRKRLCRVITAVLCSALLFGFFAFTDYIAVSQYGQVPRFRYETLYSSEKPDELLYKTIFFTAVRKHPGTENESVEIIRRK